MNRSIFLPSLSSLGPQEEPLNLQEIRVPEGVPTIDEAEYKAREARRARLAGEDVPGHRPDDRDDFGYS